MFCKNVNRFAVLKNHFMHISCTNSTADVSTVLLLKDNKILSGFSQTQQYIILFYLDDDMLLSLNHYQTNFAKLRIRYTLFK